ncbi:hypothetical protein HB774_34730 (plasmid) [Rhizobium leguminosarum bv. viciae]|nr:hypothetical protein HB774_34730 [Rhizobium leguminosarum bv. viciae]
MPQMTNDAVLLIHDCHQDQALWEDAILQGNHAFRFLREKRRGRIKLDVDKRSLSIEELP